jgi:hypothetical protein
VIALFRAIPAEYVSEWRTWFVSLLPNATLTMADVSRVTATLPLIVFLLVGAWLLLAPLAIYLAVTDE